MTGHGVAIIRTFTTSLHTSLHLPFQYLNKELCHGPLVRGTKQPYSYTGSDDSDLWRVFIKQTDYSTVRKTCLGTKQNKITGLWRSLMGYFTQNRKDMEIV